MPRAPHSERTGGLALWAAVASYVVLSFFTLDQMEEDAFIYLRFAENLAAGQGYVFNRGGEVVESGSSPLWLLLLVLLAGLRIDLVLGAKLLGIAIGAAALASVYALARRFLTDPVLRVAPVLLTAWSTPFLMWNQRGLETALHVLVVLGLVRVAVDPKSFRLWPLPAIALLLTRPEALLILLPILAAAHLHREPWRRFAASAAVVALVAAAMLAARVLYFGDALPHPFYAKMTPDENLGWPSLHAFFRGSHLYAFSLPILAVAWRRSYWEPARIVLICFIAVLFLWFGQSQERKPHHRHLAPAVPLLFVLVISSAARLAAPGSRAATRLLYAYCGAFLFASSYLSAPSRSNDPVRRDPNPLAQAAARMVAAPGAELRRLRELLSHPDRIDVTYQSLIGDFVRLNYPSSVVVAFDQMGKAPYRAGPDTIFIDLFGLTDRTIGYLLFTERARSSPLLRLACRLQERARRAGCTEADRERSSRLALDYVFGRRPDLILLNRYVAGVSRRSLPALISRDPRLASLYVPRFGLAKFISVYQRKGIDTPPLRMPEGLSIEPL